MLYEDDCYIVFEKPAGLLVIPTPLGEKNTLVHIVNTPSAVSGGSPRLYPCHRLDRDTSGAIIFAKSKENQQKMMDEFRKRRIQKTYVAFVRGKLKNKIGEIKGPVQDYTQRRFRHGKGAKLAITRYKVLEVRRLFSVVEVYPLTGRTNQIRIHFSQIDHPLLGERKYAFGRDFPVKFRRTALHAHKLAWVHPVYKKPIRILSPLPKDMEDFLAKN